jgi:hypothetical protein
MSDVWSESFVRCKLGICLWLAPVVQLDVGHARPGRVRACDYGPANGKFWISISPTLCQEKGKMHVEEAAVNCKVTGE